MIHQGATATYRDTRAASGSASQRSTDVLRGGWGGWDWGPYQLLVLGRVYLSTDRQTTRCCRQHTTQAGGRHTLLLTGGPGVHS
jgi:hypothetical protein